MFTPDYRPEGLCGEATTERSATAADVAAQGLGLSLTSVELIGWHLSKGC